MKRILQKLMMITAYAAATLLILLAVIVGLFRLFLPRLPEYQEEIKTWASGAIGMQVEFSGMNARWALSGPELDFYDAELVRADNQNRMIAAQRVSVSISVNRLLFERRLEVDRLSIHETSIEVRQLEGGGWWVQGSALDDLPIKRDGGPRGVGDIEVVGEDIEIGFLQPGDERPRSFLVSRVLASLDDKRIAIDALVRLPDDLGRQVEISATQLRAVAPEYRSWDVTVEADNVLLAGWSDFLPVGGGRQLAGTADVDLSLAMGRDGITSATVDFELDDVSLESGRAFGAQGRVEYDRSVDGWFVDADEFRISTSDNVWPVSTFRAEAGVDAQGNIVMLDLRASYLNLQDSDLIQPLLPDAQRASLDGFAPSGEIRELSATVSDIGRERQQYDVTAEFEGFGFAAAGSRPGLRGFTGRVSASGSGGSLEIRSADMLLDLPRFSDTPLDIDTATGNIIWRISNDRVTVMSDSIRIVNPVLDTRINMQLTVGTDGSAPEVDLVSAFSIGDVGAARRYIPRRIMKPKLYDWFQGALLAGSIERGTARLSGPLDKFPFDNGEGRFLLEGAARNLTFQYHPRWPAAEQADMDIVLDNARLYTLRNRSLSAGNLVVDAEVDIADLRRPVLTIRGLATGTLETLRQFALQSPIDTYTGGNLDRVAVSGDASFDLDLVVPLKDTKSATVDGLLRSNNGTLTVAGLDAPITDLIGEVRITREQITSESLGGRFLGADVALRIGPGEDPRYFAVATATGAASATAIIEELGVPLQGLIEGAAPYEARVLFPRGNQDEPTPFTVRIASPTRGLALNLPQPLQKAADEAMLIRGDIRFMPGGERIESSGVADNDIAWQIAFTRPDGEWTLDRGVLKAGGGSIEPAETRGLHIRGRTSTARLEDWLNLSREGETKSGAAQQIRSVDLLIDDFFAIGQHLRDHRVRVDRSARDWLVQVEGEDVNGSVFVPYDFGSDRAMVVEMQRLHLPGDDVSPPSESQLDPRKLPPIQLTADEFALGDRYVGAVEANLVRTPDGLETDTLSTRDASFEIVGSGRWVADDAEELGSRTYVTATLNSSNVGATLARLDFAQGITGENMGILFDMSWGGGPRADFLELLDGIVQLRLENGQLEEVEPGAGRMLGLVSFVALPRRLSLDFRDVFNKGFRYDSIAGSFKVTDGVAATCDLSLEGPAADIGIVGQVNLAAEQYEQAAVVSAKVGNTLPLVGAVVGGPPGAAAMLIFSQIFKKPLQEVGQVFYSMVGSWEEPDINSIDSNRFVRYGELAGCLDNAER